MMMKSLPHAVVVGLATRGASGNPKPITVDPELQVTVSFSRWVRTLPSGEVLEGAGVAPHVEVEWDQEAEGDGTLDAGLVELDAAVASLAASGGVRAPPPPPPPPPTSGGGGGGRGVAWVALGVAALLGAL
mmetsp:Transcript_57638/g.182559  ORF Transcript_57638/g.182559 Transcript_57638/m.182559 type:complete len:131 (+) Transcript_57638:311-703(+)